MKTKTTMESHPDERPRWWNSRKSISVRIRKPAISGDVVAAEESSHRNRGAAVVQFVLGLTCLLFLASCTTPDLKPFAEASKTLSASVNTGGDLAIKPLARMPVWDGAKYVQPDDPKHPAKALVASWEIRRKAMDAVLVYSSSLAAINEAAAHRKENATELVGSVKQLASAVPTLGTGVSAAGDLVVFGLGTYVEIKAWHDMRKAVESADPAIQLVAKALKKDFVELSNEFESKPNDHLIQLDVSLRPVTRIHDALTTQRDAQRTRVAGAPGDAILGAELARLDGLLAATDVDLNKLETEKTKIEGFRADGLEFYTSAIKAVDAWAAAHADLVKSFEQHRTPNLALLGARAQELKDIVDKLKK
jgi:hypothetical protein